MNFKQFLLEIKETSSGDFGYDTAEARHYEYEIMNDSGEDIGSLQGYRVVMIKERVGYTFAVLDDDAEEIEFISKVEKDYKIDGIQSYSQNEVWKNKDNTDFTATDVIFNFILKEVKLLISDRYQTKDGKKLWKNIFKQSKYKNKEAGIYFKHDDKIEKYDYKTNITEFLDKAYQTRDDAYYLKY